MTDLFGAESAAETEATGHRTTPECVGRTLATLMGESAREFVLDLGCGDGDLALGLYASGARPMLALVDIRPGVAERAADRIGAAYGGSAPWAWRPFDASQPWTHPRAMVAAPLRTVIANPPWSRQRCPKCGDTWDAGHHSHCKMCSSYGASGKLVRRADGEDVAQAMVREGMRACPAAEFWVVHTTDWRFHEQRARFFLPADDPACTRPVTHALAGITDVAERVAWGDPAKRGNVAKHNKMTSFYHFAPAASASERPYHRMLATWTR